MLNEFDNGPGSEKKKLYAKRSKDLSAIKYDPITDIGESKCFRNNYTAC